MNRTIQAYSCLAIITLAAWLSYLPGLSGGFLFDDFVNLDALGATGPVDNWATFFRYITSGTADPTGRPVALLSFLLDARDWPAPSAPFLKTNLVFHVFNGLLLFALVRKLGQLLGDHSDQARFTAALASGIWMLHPLFVSTTLYIVQREAMLPATATLAGLLLYLKGVQTTASGRPIQGSALMVGAVVGGTILATLCKANGVLLPLLAWVIHATIIRHRGTPPASRRFESRQRILHIFLLVMPSLLVLMYLLSFVPDLDSRSTGREWTGWQRLITEPRVVLDYIRLLAVPRSISSGVYNDGFVVSSSLLSPAGTLPSLALVILIPCLAWWYRLRHPALAAAVLFYFGGLLIESTTIQLELYFEHRNYLPALLLSWPISRAIVNSRAAIATKLAIATLILGMLAATTFARATLWGQPQVLAELWARSSPNSARAQVTAAMLLSQSGKHGQALARLGPQWEKSPDDLQFAFNYINATCAFKGVSKADLVRLQRSLEVAGASARIAHGWLSNAITVAAEGTCPGLTLDEVDKLVAALARNPIIHKDGRGAEELEPLYALVALNRGLHNQALLHFNRAFLASPTPDVAARQAAMLASRGAFKEAAAHLDLYDANLDRLRLPAIGMASVHAWVLRRQDYWPTEMAVLRSKIDAELSP